jgi:hypothetical protein
MIERGIVMVGSSSQHAHRRIRQPVTVLDILSNEISVKIFVPPSRLMSIRAGQQPKCENENKSQRAE